MKMDFVDPTLSAKAIGKRFSSLSRREVDVCCLIARRFTTSEIAMCLSISPRTVEKHLESVFRKLDVHSREHLRSGLGVRPPTAMLRE